MTVERSRITFLFGGAALVTALATRTPAAAQGPAITVYRDPG